MPSERSPGVSGYSSTLCLSASNSASTSGAYCSPVSMRLLGRLRCSKRALPLALWTSSGCCRISTSTAWATGAIQRQMQLDTARRQAGQRARLAGSAWNDDAAAGLEGWLEVELEVRRVVMAERVRGCLQAAIVAPAPCQGESALKTLPIRRRRTPPASLARVRAPLPLAPLCPASARSRRMPVRVAWSAAWRAAWQVA